ncbi:MAG: TonB-dependent receptor [Bacteroidetes bacterium]|nr:TonB-dependent receptor [Bacteroidota bacterium]
MKRIAIIGYFIFNGAFVIAQQSQLQEVKKDSFYLLTPVEVRAVRATGNAPFTKTNLSKQEIEKNNLGQDIPFILNQTPSVVVNSDAGTGIGYTGIRIRGTDGTRINITLNGIPYNDAESQISYFVDLPDFASSVNSIQIQRGVGTSSNGAGAFGASINFSTNEVKKDKYVELSNAYGSFNTWKNTLKAGTGLINDHFTADIRLSSINSNGYIDRASSNLKSLYVSTAFIGKYTSLRFNFFSGKEKTYQAWYGVSEEDLKTGNRRINYAGLEDPNGPYPNETDNYRQTHFQLFFDQRINQHITFNTALFYTNGKGYYEEYRAGQDYSKYSLPYPIRGNDTIYTSDFIRRLWLNNNFYGNIFSFQYKDEKTQATFGGGATRYNGKHYGILTWASNGLTGPDRWYNNNALKTDFNIYLKQQTRFANNWYYFYDLQFRYVKYLINGFKDNPALIIKNNFYFFNPKTGISYNRNSWRGYFSYSKGSHEPNRDDFEANQNQQPRSETLHDFELGVERSGKTYNWGAVLYYMLYKNQLVLTGKINDIGAYTRSNIPKSFRTGIELQGGINLSSWFKTSANLSFSNNKVLNFTEYIDDYDNGTQKVNHFHATDIALSPAIVGGAVITFLPVKDFEISFVSKYVGKQYLDNTQQESRRLDPFFTEDARLIYSFKYKWLKQINLLLKVNNIFNAKYEPGGYTYNYIAGGILSVNNYYFPMAGTNLMIGVNVKL